MVKIPEVCYSKLFQTILFAAIASSFTFTQIMFQINHDEIKEVKGDSTTNVEQLSQNIIRNADNLQQINNQLQQTNKKLDVLVCEIAHRCN